jgi:hypothetical protein
MSGSHAEDIVVEYLEAENWASLDDPETEPELDTPPLPASPPGPAAT